MSLRDIYIKSSYNSRHDDVIRNFFVPCLSEGILYQRAVGYFKSQALVDLSKGICSLAQRNGQIQLIASPELSEDDMEAIKKGYENRDNIIERALITQIPSCNNFDQNSIEIEFSSKFN